MIRRAASRFALAWANRPLRTKGLIVVAFPLVALLLVAPLYYLSQRRAHEAADLVVQTLEVRDQIDDVRSVYLEAALGIRGYLLTGSDDFLQRYQEAADGLPAALARLRELAQDSTVQRLIQEMEPVGEELLGILEQLRSDYRPGEPPSLQQEALVLRTMTLLGSLREKLDSIEDRENQLLSERTATADAAERLTTIAIAVSLPVGLLVGFLATLLFTAGVSRRVKRLQENARSLAEGRSLIPLLAGEDEIGRLGAALEEAAALLMERQVALGESQEKYRTLARNFPNGAVALFDRDLRYTLLEGGVLGALGLSKQDFEGKTIWEALPAETARAVEPIYRAALNGESNVSEIVSRDRVYFAQVVPVHGEDGDVEGGMVVALDITERKRAEDEVREVHAFLDSIVENIPNMIFVKEADSLRFVRFNKAGENLLGYTRAELIGKNDYDFFPKEEADFFTKKDREVLEDKQLLDLPEEPIRTKEKGLRILHTKKIPILDEGGRPQYLLGISEDITDRKRAEEAIRLAKEEAERANRAKDEFLSRMSHELRTPLNAVLGFAQLLEMDELGSEHQESVKQILKGGRHLLGLIDEVLDISRIATGKLSLSPEPVLVTEALREAVDLVQPLAAKRRIDLHAEDANGLHVLADRQRLKQVLLNLVSNGVKYNREGGRVAVSWEKAPQGRLRITVTDTGPGIRAEVMDRVFEAFDRLGADQTGVEGTGLGLALSKGLVEAMGGTIEVQSEAGAGTAFTIELPLAEPPLQRYEREREGQGGPAEAAAGGHTVLCIEDNSSNLTLIERVLASRPRVKLLSAMQGGLGLELAREHQPDLILLDLHLPDMSGEEALRRLREHPATRRIPAVMISADATPGRIKRLFAAGARDYLTKPLDVKRFLEVVDDALQVPSGRQKA